MQRCLQLARQGLGKVAPNPMVGSVIVHHGKIIGEGFHQAHGGPHAEVEAVNSVSKENRKLLPESTMYVSLEPCNHKGKTPPCTELILKHQIPEVVIATADPNKEVTGNGIARLKEAGVKVKVGVLEAEAKTLNARFFTYHQKQRPYIVLKWAQSRDGYLARQGEQTPLSNDAVNRLVHRWRSEESSIMVGTNTALIDNPKLNNRLWPGNPPLRVVVDRYLRLSPDLNIFDQSQPTMVLTEEKKKGLRNLSFVQVRFGANLISDLLNALYERKIQSMLVEGGGVLLQQFLDGDLWDETRVISTPHLLEDGLPAPPPRGVVHREETILSDTVTWYRPHA